jgi:signal transduction histidine kinase
VTVRARITLVATLVVAVVLAVAGIGLVVQQRRALTEALDESLQTRAAELESLASRTGTVPAPITGLGDDDAMAQVVVDGEVVASSGNLRDQGPILPSVEGEGMRTVDGMPHEDEAFRIAVAREGDAVAVVGSPLDDVDDSVTALLASLVVTVPLVVGALALVLWWVVGRALRPVEAIRAEVAAIGAHDLERRVPIPSGDDEIARLGRTMNEMLERVDHATQRQRRFVADASHELRSPLTRIRTELEVDLAHPDQADPFATHASVLEEAIGLQRLADDLLLIARVDERGGGIAVLPVDLDDVVVRVARRLRADDRVQVDLSAVSAGRVLGDRDLLVRMVGNLADNAVRHARSVVRFSLVADGEQVVLSVEDDGPGIPEEERDRVFERFARVDVARSADGGGTGLGLAIARDVAASHGGRLVLDPAAPGARFVLTLPATM